MRKATVPTTKERISLTEKGMLCLKNIRKAGCFRSDSSTIEECLIFIQSLRDGDAQLKLEILGKRFGISVEAKNTK